MENICKAIITIMAMAFTSIILGFFSANLYENDPKIIDVNAIAIIVIIALQIFSINILF